MPARFKAQLVKVTHSQLDIHHLPSPRELDVHFLVHCRVQLSLQAPGETKTQGALSSEWHEIQAGLARHFEEHVARLQFPQWPLFSSDPSRGCSASVPRITFSTTKRPSDARTSQPSGARALLAIAQRRVGAQTEHLGLLLRREA